MNRLYVASQDKDSREWIPVAELCQTADGFTLRYTRGAGRLPGFSGLGRMQDLYKVYHSRNLFPFFANRIISKSRPEYKQYLSWLGLSDFPESPLEILRITGGIRATDSFELISTPSHQADISVLEIFPRGLRYLAPEFINQLMTLSEGVNVCLMNDLQNDKDPSALAIRSTQPQAMLIGYIPRYYCDGFKRLLNEDRKSVRGHIKRVNVDAPLDMKLLLSFEFKTDANFDFFSSVEDCRYLSEALVSEDFKEMLSITNMGANSAIFDL